MTVFNCAAVANWISQTWGSRKLFLMFGQNYRWLIRNFRSQSKMLKITVWNFSDKCGSKISGTTKWENGDTSPIKGSW